MAKKRTELAKYSHPALALPPDGLARPMSAVDKEMRRGGFAYLKGEAKTSGQPVVCDLGLVVTADDQTVKMLVTVTPEGACKYVYG